MKDQNFSPDAFFQAAYEARPRPFEGKNAEETVRECLRLREKMRDILAIDKIPGKTQHLEPQLIFSEKRSSYEIRALSVEICSGLNMLCYMLIPERADGVGVVAVPGHGYGVRQIIRQSKSGKYRKINFFDNYQKNFAEELALRGNTVIAFEPVAFGKARLKKDSRKPFYISSCETVSMHSLMYGFSAASLRVYQAVRCVDILCEAGCSHIGIMGISGGGLVALYTSLIEDRIEKTVVSGYINTFGKSVLSMWHCPDNYIPSILETGDMYDFAAALAPRRLLMECGKKDKLFPVDASLFAVEKISQVYKRLGAEDCFTADIHQGAHQVSGRIAFDFFGKDA